MDCKTSHWRQLKSLLNNLPPEEFVQQIPLTPGAVVLDVRTEKEFDINGLPGAQLLDYFGESFYEILDSLDKDAPYFVYCRSGRRSLRVCTLMRNSGFTRVYNMEGGLASL